MTILMVDTLKVEDGAGGVVVVEEVKEVVDRKE
jgi:hypothetical protein